MAFNTTTRFQNDWELVELEEDRLGTRVEIIPTAGAILNGWEVGNMGKKMDIIDGYSGKEDFQANVHNGFKSAKLSPFVCRLKNGRFNWAGNEFSIQKFMLNGDGLHGILYDAPFTVTSSGSNENQCFVEMQYEYRGDFKGFPFPYISIIRYTLKDENQLHISTKIINRAGVAMPLSDGWHPYFKLGGKVDDWWLKLASDQMLEYDSSLIPTGNYIQNSVFREGRKIGALKLDNGFKINSISSPYCSLKNDSNKISIEFISETNYPFLQLYIPDHRESIAIENLSSAPDSFNNGIGLTELQPGEEKIFEVLLQVRAE
jgi:aldose 1-epimerase